MSNNKYEINLDLLELFDTLPTAREEKNFLHDAFCEMDLKDRIEDLIDKLVACNNKI